MKEAKGYVSGESGKIHEACGVFFFFFSPHLLESLGQYLFSVTA
jgi:hypothetical protein